MDGQMIEQMTVLQMAASGQNVASFLPSEELAKIGSEAVRLYKLDKSSMSEWLKMMERGIELAKLVAKDKSYPFPGAANVKYPLITTAALQFNARSYPAIVPADGAVVKGRTFGADKDGLKAARADRVAAHMSWQLINRIDEWEEETDRLLVQLPIVGTMVRKVWYDEVMGRPKCRLIDPGKFIVNDNVKTLTDAPRQTEEFTLYPYELTTKRLAGSYRDVDYVDGAGEDDQEPQDFIEQHTRLDLDGDGYEEPYIVTVHVETERVARIVGDFRMEDILMGPMGVTHIPATTYFIPYHFMPSIDGGFWGTGFGLLLGGISETVNTLINMMLDAGHMASLGGGFLGSEFRIKGGGNRFRPGEWKTPAAKGSDIKQSIVPLTFPGPDATLFQLLGLLIEAGNDVAGIKDVLMGDTGGRAQTATTTMALIEQGMQQFTAIYKRVYRSLRHEYKQLAYINASTVSPEEYNAFHDEEMPAVDPMSGQVVPGPDGAPMMVPAQYDPAEEYGYADMDICPVADPRSVSKMQEAAKAAVVMELAQAQMVDPMEAAKRTMEAASIGDVDDLMPKPNPLAQVLEQAQAESMMTDLQQKKVDVELTLAKIDSERAKAAETMAGIQLEQHQQRLDGLKLMMEDRRERLDTLLSSGFGAMAGGPGGPVRQVGPMGYN